MRLLIWVLLLAACSADNDKQQATSLLTEVGRLENSRLDEASGIAASRLHDELFWAINDDGPAVLHALSPAGADLGRVLIDGARNRDWEDIAAFELAGTAYLIVADIGDNDAEHEYLSLYVVEEPAMEADETELAWRIDFRYPDGARDAEALAVDPVARQVYVLSKRTLPAELYRLPLQPGDGATITAEFVGYLDKLPQPSPAELQNPAGSGYGWQPTGMDFAPDGRSALVLTYAGLNFFSRSAGQSWPDALQGRAMHFSLRSYRNAESVAFTRDSEAAMVTVEQKHAPVLRVELAL